MTALLLSCIDTSRAHTNPGNMSCHSVSTVNSTNRKSHTDRKSGSGGDRRSPLGRELEPLDRLRRRGLSHPLRTGGGDAISADTLRVTLSWPCVQVERWGRGSQHHEQKLNADGCKDLHQQLVRGPPVHGVAPPFASPAHLVSSCCLNSFLPACLGVLPPPSAAAAASLQLCCAAAGGSAAATLLSTVSRARNHGWIVGFAGPTTARHVGHSAFRRSQSRRQCRWYSCKQASLTAVSPGRRASKQILHSSESASVAASWTVLSSANAAGLRPGPGGPSRGAGRA